jgi:DNA replication protein DnaC
MHNQATLPLLLKQLNLSSMYSQWEELSLQAQKEKWEYAEYLTVLVNRELASRQQKRIQRHLKESALPLGKTLDTFDFTVSKSINPAQITGLANTIDWVQQANNLMIFGPSGVGKTHTACAIGHRLIEKGARVFFTPTTSLVQKLQQARHDYKLNDYLNKLSRFNVLILDDIAYDKKDEAETSVLFELIAHRYENQSLVITSNQPFKEWDQIFPDNIMAVAAIDRLVQHSTIINITDDSFRRSQSIQN